MNKYSAPLRNSNQGFNRFREAFLDGRLKPGMNVTQSELCDILDTSLSPLRETLVLLEEYGLVEIRQRAGIRIIFPEVKFIRENYQFRIMIELNAIKVFINSVTDEELSILRQSHLNSRADFFNTTPYLTAQKNSSQIDRAMHEQIVESLDNREIIRTHSRLFDNINLARHVHLSIFSKEQLVSSIDEHLLILEQLEARNLKGASDALEAHFRASTFRMFTSS